MTRRRQALAGGIIFSIIGVFGVLTTGGLDAALLSLTVALAVLCINAKTIYPGLAILFIYIIGMATGVLKLHPLIFIPLVLIGAFLVIRGAKPPPATIKSPSVRA